LIAPNTHSNAQERDMRTGCRGLGLGAIVLAGLAGCHDPVVEMSCPGAAVYAYDPEHTTRAATAFPDDFLSVDDPSTLTGLRLHIAEDNSPWILDTPESLLGVFEGLNTLDGWGTTAGITLRFNGALKEAPNGSPASLESSAVQLWELGSNPHRVPFESKLTDDDTTLILYPMVPLTPKTRHAVFVTKQQQSANGCAVESSATLQSLLTGKASTAPLQRLAPRYTDALAAAKLKAEEISAAVVFTTQSVVEQSVAIAQDIQQRTYTWKTKPTCRDDTLYRLCSASFVAQDYRKNGSVQGIQPVATYELPVRLWLPKDKAGPWPLMIFGHGLSGDKSQGDALAEIAAPKGIAGVAIDALMHGEHPTAPGNSLVTVLKFFGMDTGNVQPLILRDNWRQSTYDKLQLLRLLSTVGDLDGDDVADIKLNQMGYYGVSLGGIMGGEFLALQDQLGFAVLSVPGGRVASIIESAPRFSFIVDGFKGPTNTQGDVDRFFPILQAAIDRGDASNYATHILTNRLPVAPTRIPHLLFNEVIDDDTVPNVCNHSLARALNIPQVPQVRKDVGLIPLLPSAPISGNLAGGALTAGLFQFDRIRKHSDTPVIAAMHDNVSKSYEALHQTEHFLTTWLDTGVPEILDPYEALQTAPLSPAQ
jgi:hypothetical protein